MSDGTDSVTVFRVDKGPGIEGTNKLWGQIRDLKIGVLSGVGAHPGSEEGETVAEVAWKNEFGVGIPERPFLRPAMKNKRADYTKLIVKILVAIAAGRMTPKQGEALLGFDLQTAVQTQIDLTMQPPNSEATILKKGSSHPLINTGLM